MCVLCKLAVGGRPKQTEGETPTGKGVSFFGWTKIALLQFGLSHLWCDTVKTWSWVGIPLTLYWFHHFFFNYLLVINTRVVVSWSDQANLDKLL